MLSPSILKIAHPGSDMNYLVGPLVIAFSVIALSEVIRPIRFVNIFLGILLIISPFWLVGFATPGFINNLIFGALILFLALKKSKICERYGKW